MTRTNPHEEAAHQYADVGWPVFPCVNDSKYPATKHGLHDATTDHRQIGRWFRKHPLSNVGIATGAPGPDVVDVDVHGAVNGYAAWNRLQRERLVDGPGAIVRTPSGGMHAYFRGTEQRNGHIVSACVDFRAQGGYVVAPPSTIGGRAYEVVEHHPRDATVDWSTIKSVLQPETERRPQHRPERSTEATGDVSRLASWLARQPEGNRNHGLYYAANRALEAGHDGLEELAEAGRQLGLSEREITKTIESARRITQIPFERQADSELEAEAS
jgi:Bifunctional DNA primase/polymerase, N-terminal